MTTATLTEYRTDLAIEFFERKLAFEVGPIGLARQIEAKTPVQVVDLRTPELFAKGHVPGAVNIDFEDLKAGNFKLNKDSAVVVYCYDIVCHLSAMAALELAKKGYKAQELVGGYADWEKHELPVEVKSASCSTEQKAGSCGCG